jgi:flagellar protein FlaG
MMVKINPVSSELQVSPATGGPMEAVAKVINRTGNRQENGGEPSRDSLEKAIEKLSKTTEFVDKRLQFSIHKESERMQVFVIDNETQEVIKKIPPEEFLDIVARIQEMVGLLLDERV